MYMNAGLAYFSPQPRKPI